MKKTLLIAALALIIVGLVAVAATSLFPKNKASQVEIRDLTFKEVMRAFYSGDMMEVPVEDEDISAMPHIALNQENNEQDITVAAMHPIVSYLNNDGEQRYLIIIEKVQVDSEGLFLQSCHACEATADLYTFKQLDNGLFQLVSRTPKNIEISSSWGRIDLSAQAIHDGIQPLGKNLMGSIFSSGYSSTGTTVTWWEALHLPEDELIRIYKVGDAGSDNSGSYDESSPLYYGYQSFVEVMSDNSKYFPIELTFTGEMPDENYDRIEPVNFTTTVKFNPLKKGYYE